MTVLVSRVPWSRVTAALLAFESARRDRSTAPLSPFFRSSALSGVEITRKKRFGIFGEARTVLPRASTFLVAAIEQASLESLDLSEPLLTALGGDARRAIEACFSHDHALPAWMAGDDGPSLVSPEEVRELSRALEHAKPAWPDGERDKLGALLARCETEQGLLIEP